MSGEPALRLTFWGVRGSFPTPEPGNLGHGGNTASLEIQYGDQERLIFDAGSGIWRLGNALVESSGPQGGSARLFLSHFHWDHILGIPFFAPLYQPRWKLVIHAAYPGPETEARLAVPLMAPYFDAESAICAQREYLKIDSDAIRAGGLTIRSFPLNHPGGCVGYRVESPSASIVYATDHEHGDSAADTTLREHAREADLLICDAQYTPEEYPRHKGWGHSTWLEATRAARDAGVKRLILFHHDPGHDDRMLARILSEAQAEFSNTICATEGWSTRL